MKRPHFAWAVCIGCTLVLFCTVGLTSSAFSVFQPYLIEAGGLTNTQSSSILTIRSLFAFLSVLVVDKYLKLAGEKRGIIIAMTMCALSFILFAVFKSFGGYCIAAVIGGIVHGLGGMVPVTIVIDRWFSGRKALALGICSAGSGMSAIAFPPLVTAIIESTSLFTAFMFEVAFILVCTVAGVLLIKSDPKKMGIEPYSVGGDPKTAAVARHADIGKKGLVVMMLALLLLGGFSSPAWSHFSVLYSTQGFDAMTVATLLSLSGISLTIGKLVYGQVTDKLGTFGSGMIFLSFIVCGAILCCFAFTGSVPVAYIAMLAVGFGLPICTVGISMYAADLSGESKFALTLKRFQSAHAFGSLAFTALPGIVADRFGSYIPAYIILAVFAAVAVVLIQGTYMKSVIKTK